MGKTCLFVLYHETIVLYDYTELGTRSLSLYDILSTLVLYESAVSRLTNLFLHKHRISNKLNLLALNLSISDQIVGDLLTN